MTSPVSAAPASTGRLSVGRVVLLLLALGIVAAGVFLVWRYHPGLGLLRSMLVPLQNWNASEPVMFALIFLGSQVSGIPSTIGQSV